MNKKRVVLLVLMSLFLLIIAAGCDDEADAWSECETCTSGDCDGATYDGGICENAEIILGGALCLVLGISLAWASSIRKQGFGSSTKDHFAYPVQSLGRMWMKARTLFGETDLLARSIAVLCHLTEHERTSRSLADD